jgi:undecaprenyl-diphosphatase
MDYLTGIILGIVQGLTEFLPVSSSGHLVLGQALLGVDDPGKTVEVAVHVGTLLSVVVYFHRSLLGLVQALFRRERVHERWMIAFLIVGTIPAVVAYLFFKPLFDRAYTSPSFASAMLLVTGVILFVPRWFSTPERQMSAGRAFLTGCAQAFAILPGISRSGSTISTALLLGIRPSAAAEFSFLLAIPAILGAVVTEYDAFVNLARSGTSGPYLVSVLAAFLVGLVAIYAVMSSVRGGRFHWFAYYCFVVGVAGLVIFPPF